MGEFLDYFRQKKNLVNLLLLAILVLALPLIVQTVRQQQIIKSRAVVDPIVFVSDNVVDLANGQKGFKLDAAGKPIVGLELSSPIESSTQTVQSENILMSLVPKELIGIVYAGHDDGCGATNSCSTGTYCSGNDVYQDQADGGHVGVESCPNGCENGACKSAPPPAGNPPPATNGDWWGCSAWDSDNCSDKSKTCKTSDGKAGVVCTQTCKACGSKNSGMTWGGKCFSGGQWTVCVAANQDTQGGPCKETATLTSDCAMCIYKEKNKSGGNLYDTVRGMDVQRLAQCNYEQTASVWCNEVDPAGCASIKSGACGQPTPASGTYPASPNCSTGNSVPAPKSGDTNPNGIACKTPIEPSELGINSPSVCDRLHDYVLVNSDGSTSTCAQNNTCTKKEDCPQNKSDSEHIVASDSNWCYGFKDGARCIQLRYTGLAQEPGCAPGEGNGGPNACTNLDACSKCILTTKDTIIPYYASNGRDTSCSNLGNIFNEWCSSVDPSGCQSLKTGSCLSSCGGTACPADSNLTIAPSTVNVGDTIVFQYKAGEDVFIGGDTWSGGIDEKSCQFDLEGRKYTCKAQSAVDNGVWQHRWNNKANCGSATYKIIGSTPSVTTVSFRIAESPADFAETGQYGWQDYTSTPMKTTFEFKDKNPGLKNIFVEFKDSNGKPFGRKNAQIKLLNPDPVIASCFLSFEPNNTTILNLIGTNFGTPKGTVKSGDKPLDARQWNDTTIKAVFPNAPEGEKLPVSLTNADGQSVDTQCSAIAQLSLGAKVFCRTASSQDTDNVDLTLVGDFAGGTTVKQKVKIDKEGNVVGLTQKLEDGQKYKLSLKAPKSLRRTVSFTAGSGTNNIPDFKLPVGDIFPILGGDGTINSMDKSELNRQWIIAQPASGRTGDFNGDTRVNSIDWACMRYDFGTSDDSEPTSASASASLTR